MNIRFNNINNININILMLMLGLIMFFLCAIIINLVHRIHLLLDVDLYSYLIFFYLFTLPFYTSFINIVLGPWYLAYGINNNLSHGIWPIRLP